MLNKIFKNLELREYIVLIILCLCAVLWFYFFPSKVYPEDTERVQLVLSSKPEFYNDSEGNKYIKLIDDNFKRPFKIRDCALDLIVKEDVLSLDYGSELWVVSEYKSLISEKTFINNYILIYGIELSNGNKILKLSDYNFCKKNDWKTIAIISILLIAFLFMSIEKKIEKREL